MDTDTAVAYFLLAKFGILPHTVLDMTDREKVFILATAEKMAKDSERK